MEQRRQVVSYSGIPLYDYIPTTDIVYGEAESAAVIIADQMSQNEVTFSTVDHSSYTYTQRHAGSQEQTYTIQTFDGTNNVIVETVETNEEESVDAGVLDLVRIAEECSSHLTIEQDEVSSDMETHIRKGRKRKAQMAAADTTYVRKKKPHKKTHGEKSVLKLAEQHKERMKEQRLSRELMEDLHAEKMSLAEEMLSVLQHL